jgi:signal transduction histidine kinase
MDSLVRENRQDFIEQEMNSIAREFDSYLSLRQKSLKDYANFPILLQTVMHPDSNQSNIRDFMNEITLLGEKVPLTLRDYQGLIIYSTKPLKRNLDIPTKQITSNNEPFIKFIEIGNPNISIELFVPIYYQGHVEGYLQATIFISQISEFLALDARSKHHRLQFKVGDEIFLELGDKSLTLNPPISMGKNNIILSYQTKDPELFNSRRDLVVDMLLWLAAICLFINIISNKIGKKYLIMPLERLREFSSKLADGSNIYLTLEKDSKIYQFNEINDLELNFQEMAKKVIHREDSLKSAKDSLQELNDRLVEHQQQLLHSEKLASVGQLAAGVAHEINNPTGFVMGNIEVLKDYKEDLLNLFKHYQVLEHCIQQEDMQAIKAQLEKVQIFKSETDIDYILKDMSALISDSLEGTNRIKNIVQDLKNFSRVDSVVKKPIDINEDVIETALRLVWNEIKYKCTLEKDLTPLPVYPCNSGELSQVILNLLVNACDSVTEKGIISISSHYMEGYIEIKVSDNGCGIKDKDLNKLFDPFFTTKEIGKGTGLGLSISHRIIEKHGGILSVASQLNKGTVFTIMLPVEES